LARANRPPPTANLHFGETGVSKIRYNQTRGRAVQARVPELRSDPRRDRARTAAHVAAAR
jgi:hypothetical protein